MPIILIIEKNSTIKPLSVKTYDEARLCTKAGFKSAEGFKCHHTWAVKLNDRAYNVSLYGKTNGAARFENKYDFPPPADNLLFFGNCVLVNKTQSGEVEDITPDEWNQIYEKLFGGFYDLDKTYSDDDDEEDVNTDEELAQIKQSTGTMPSLTSSGYMKDDFVVDSEEEDCYNSDGEKEKETAMSKRKPAKKTTATPSKKKTKKNEPVIDNVNKDEYIGFTCELSEEPYV